MPDPHLKMAELDLPDRVTAPAIAQIAANLVIEDVVAGKPSCLILRRLLPFLVLGMTGCAPQNASNEAALVSIVPAQPPPEARADLIGFTKEQLVEMLGSPTKAGRESAPLSVSNLGVPLTYVATYQWGPGITQAGPLRKPVKAYDTTYVLFDAEGRAAGIRTMFSGPALRVQPIGADDERGFALQGGTDFRVMQLPTALVAVPAQIDGAWTVPEAQWGLRVNVRDHSGIIQHPATFEPMNLTVRWDLANVHIMAVLHPLWVETFDTSTDIRRWGWGETFADWGVASLMVVPRTSASEPMRERGPLSLMVQRALISESDFAALYSVGDAASHRGPAFGASTAPKAAKIPPPPNKAEVSQESVEVLYQRGKAALARHDYAAAHDALGVCIAQEPNHTGCHWEMGWVHWMSEDWDKAEQEWLAVQAIDPDYPEVSEWLPKARQKNGQPSAVAVAAPSFDCAMAAAPVEILICSDVALATADRRMGEAYKNARIAGRASSVGQRSWIEDRNQRCAVTSTPPDPQAAVECLISETNKRAITLRVGR